MMTASLSTDRAIGVGQAPQDDKVLKDSRRSGRGLVKLTKPSAHAPPEGPTAADRLFHLPRRRASETEMAKRLRATCSTRDALIRIDMSEYMEKFAVCACRAPPDTSATRRGTAHGESPEETVLVVLLDEIEKAHPTCSTSCCSP